jgi:hypothetical protein
MDREDSKSPPSRRDALQWFGAALATAPAILAAGSAGAQSQPGNPVDGSGPPYPPRPPLNPRNAYPKPPFPPQEQARPGLASRMQPRPDHGETSYVGSGRLVGRKALITGGDSGIGRAAAIAYAREGADVAFGYLPVEEKDAREVVHFIQAAGRKAVPLPGDIRSEAFCQQLVADAVRELGGLDILVNNAAFQASRPSIAEVTTDQFDSTFKTNVYANFLVVCAAPSPPPSPALGGRGVSQRVFATRNGLRGVAQRVFATPEMRARAQLIANGDATAVTTRNSTGTR